MKKYKSCDSIISKLKFVSLEYAETKLKELTNLITVQNKLCYTVLKKNGMISYGIQKNNNGSFECYFRNGNNKMKRIKIKKIGTSLENEPIELVDEFCKLISSDVKACTTEDVPLMFWDKEALYYKLSK